MNYQAKVMPAMLHPIFQKEGTVEGYPLGERLLQGMVPWDVVALLAITHPKAVFTSVWAAESVSVSCCCFLFDKNNLCQSSFFLLLFLTRLLLGA
jgi:hypothetical protein